MELFAVFSSPKTYTVQTAEGRPLGSLTQAFVDRLVEDVSSFLLGGRAWAVVRVQHDDRRVIVLPAPKGRQPTWGGFLPQFLSREVCQQIQRVLTDDEAYGFLGDEAAAVLAEHRAAMGHILGEGRSGLEVDAGEIRWWTFAGGRINATLRYALEAVGGDWKVIADNFLLKIRAEDLDKDSFDRAVARLQDIELWEDETLWAGVAAALPNYRLSKFQPLMPPWVEREVVAGYLLDVAGAWSWLSGTEPQHLDRLPVSVGVPTAQDTAHLDRLSGVHAELPVLNRNGAAAWIWVATDAELDAAVAALAGESVIGLDVETTLGTQALCLIQLAGSRGTYLIDVLEVTDLTPLVPLLASHETSKVIHHAAFERQVLGRHGLVLEEVYDTLEVSRRKRTGNDQGGHSLRAVCARELGCHLDKTEQTSDWTHRPLSETQLGGE